jgi:RNA polymerase-binding transcription factor DksA
MLLEETFSELREHLEDRRRELANLRRSLDVSWQLLREPEKELEETASRETMSRDIERRSEHIQAEIRRIDDALSKMDEGGYGRCETCRKPIQLERLQTIPWAGRCVRCADVREKLSRDAVDSKMVTTEQDPPTDEEIVESIFDELQFDSRVETEDLEVSCEDGVVYLEGTLPSETSHQILLEIVNELLDDGEVVDHVFVDNQL